MNKHEQDAELYLNQLQYLTMKDLPKEVEERIKAGFAQVLKKEIGEVEAISDSPDWKQLRDKFFKECVDKKEHYPEFGDVLKVSLAPHDLFEWFKRELAAKEAISVPAQQVDVPNFIKSAYQILVGTGERALAHYMKAHNIEVTSAAQPLQPSLEEKKEDLVASSSAT